MAVQKMPLTYAWPLVMKEWYETVLRNPGIHYTFQMGRPFGKETNTLALPLPRYDGWTMRFFIYAGSTGFSRFHKKESFSTIRVVIQGGAVRLHSIANDTSSTEVITRPMGNVTEGDVYTLSIAIVGSNRFTAHFNNTFLGQVDTRRSVVVTNYIFWLASNQHRPLSMHFSRESGNNDNFGSELHLRGWLLPIGTYVAYTAEYAANGDIEVSIRQRSDVWNDALVQKYTPQGKLNTGDKFRCTVQIVPGRFLVSVSFEPKPEVLVPDPSTAVLNRLEVTFTQNVKQLQSHYVVPF